MFEMSTARILQWLPTVIIDSYPGIRAHLTGTRYLASNPKLFTIGVGKLEAAKAMKTGFVISLIISVTFHAIDQALNDQKTWHDLVAGIAVDMAVVSSYSYDSGCNAYCNGLCWGCYCYQCYNTPYYCC